MSVPCPNGIIKDLRNPYRLMYISLYMERYIDRVWEACRNGCSTKMKNSVYYVWKGCERRMNVYFLGESIKKTLLDDLKNMALLEEHIKDSDVKLSKGHRQ